MPAIPDPNNARSIAVPSLKRRWHHEISGNRCRADRFNRRDHLLRDRGIARQQRARHRLRAKRRRLRDELESSLLQSCDKIETCWGRARLVGELWPHDEKTGTRGEKAPTPKGSQ